MSEATFKIARKTKEIKLKDKDIERFWRGVDRRGEDECWEWQKYKKRGYGYIGVDGFAMITSRVAWVIANGQIPEGMIVCHKCDNPSCCNPNHLFIGTDLDNCRDRDAKGRGYDRTGGKHGRATTNEHAVLLMRAIYGSGNYTYKRIAEMFKVKVSAVSDIMLRRCWTHI